ncbi:putative monooxygenase/hydrolase [Nitrospirillum viridazoti Y2]|uniref:2-polyprenyl-6-methoxyphenol hydroxylase-like FAD-dependent oxidoreductase n=1 Tax=Nitrospirillum amazonense TaxID=28077 RepID=A0A560INR1_9PROT|nr:FAD-dependent monooxygenase [Nitrospirillum amazonense]EGX99502.1 putative monooxygenase/hydrolase [Nitrospirillum amazonense Y2]TWB60672.1 2-polyprenyl-6-methoxyphenol hydroxylase-like FAD-dependent oxidoreductase [Nitrospirillum amazonense]
MTDETLDFPVIIAGGGPVGTALAIDLALRNVASVIIEKRRDGEVIPAKANMTNIRSMEHFRRWGIADRLRQNDCVGPEVQRDVTFVTRLNGHLVHHFPKTYESTEALKIASETGEWAPNRTIETTLFDRARELPLITRLFETEVTNVSQDETGVTASIHGPDGERTVRGRYLVIATGSASPLRRSALNVRMEGRPNLGRAFSWYIRAPDLKNVWKAGPVVSMVYFYNDDRADDLLIPQNEDATEFLYYSCPMPEGFDGDNWDDVKKLLTGAVGEKIEVQPISGGSFSLHSLTAPRFDFGRTFLIGDAAHMVSPQGGFGMNLGIGDAADLGWKLQAVIEGWGGDQLLPSYTIERREAVLFCQKGAEENQEMQAHSLVLGGIEKDGPEGDAVRAEVSRLIVQEKTQQFRSIGGQLGYTYSASTIIVRDGKAAFKPLFREFKEAARPGNRAPHRFLADGSALYDHIGWGLTLMVLGEFDTAPWQEIAARRGIPLNVFAPTNPDDIATLRGVYTEKATLIRSDHHIAWHGSHQPDDIERVLKIVTGNALAQ